MLIAAGLSTGLLAGLLGSGGVLIVPSLVLLGGLAIHRAIATSLPVIYAITAYLQVKLSPTPIQDPVQAKVMQIMPIAFSVMFIFFPSGLVLYWLVNNVLSIAQQWRMNKVLERESKEKHR